MRNKAEKSEKNNKKRRIILFVILGVLLAALAAGGITAYLVLKRPQDMFEPASVKASERTKAVEPASEVPGCTQTPEASPEKIEKNIVNILIMGIDAFEDGSSSSGSQPHSDTMMVAAVNFDTHEVDLISLPRDTFTRVPGYYGYYKLNGSFNVGGGYDAPEQGFETVCRTAEQWLGGMSVDYYYAFDFAAVRQLVDAVGGVDYELDIDIIMEDGSVIKPGKRHLNGEAVLKYLRARKSTGSPTDRNRTDRQRRMVIAIFSKLKNEGKLSMLPDLLSAVNSGMWTNTSLTQTASLAAYAMRIDPSLIDMRVMDGKVNMIYDWAFGFVDNEERISLLKEVYGIDADDIAYCSREYESWLHNGGFSAHKCLGVSGRLIEYMNGYSEKNGFNSDQKEIYQKVWAAYQELDKRLEAAENTLETDGVESARSGLMAAAEEAARVFGYAGDMSWSYDDSAWWEDADINEVYVDFR